MGGFSPAKIFKPKPKRPHMIQKVVEAATAGPTVAEMDQGQIRRGRGRRASILTSTKGVDEDVTLGRKSLLG